MFTVNTTPSGPKLETADLSGRRIADSRAILVKVAESFIHHFDKHSGFFDGKNTHMNTTFHVRQPTKNNDNVYTFRFIPLLPVDKVAGVTDLIIVDKGMGGIVHDRVKNEIIITFDISHLRGYDAKK